jgi:hypothetical protein
LSIGRGCVLILFHYHFWPPYVEETEKFYTDNGFRVSLRIGRLEGDFQSFAPPLNWDDFRDKSIVFRIIEVRKGAVNITFGYGKDVMFDHVGFLVSREEHDRICNRAKSMNWRVKERERRSFISTPFNFRIELQFNSDVIDDNAAAAEIEGLELSVKSTGLEQQLSYLFNAPVATISSVVGETVTLNKAFIRGITKPNQTTPNGVQINPDLNSVTLSRMHERPKEGGIPPGA